METKPPPRICESPLEITVQLNPGMTAVDVSNKVYRLAQGIFETFGEYDPTSGIRGSGHHIAQKLAEYAEKLWLDHGGRIDSTPALPNDPTNDGDPNAVEDATNL